MSAIGLLHDHPTDEIPDSHRDLVECPPVAALTTVSADGSPQTSVVWCDFDGGHRSGSTRCAASPRSGTCAATPRVTLLCYDPRQPLRYLEIRGTVVEMTEDGAGRHLDELASKYLGRPVRYFGDVIPTRFAETEIPVLCLIRPTHVVALDAEDRGASDDDGPIGPASRCRTRGRPIPASHLDLLTRPICAVFTTIGTDGQPQSSLVWVDTTASAPWSTRHSSGGRAATCSPTRRSACSSSTPRTPPAFIQIRGDVELITAGAVAHVDELTRGSTRGIPGFYGWSTLSRSAPARPG